MSGFNSFLAAERDKSIYTCQTPSQAKGYQYIGRTVTVSITLVKEYRGDSPCGYSIAKDLGLVDRLDGLLSLRLSWPTIISESAH